MPQRENHGEMSRKASGLEVWVIPILTVLVLPFVLLWVAGMLVAKLTHDSYGQMIPELVATIKAPADHVAVWAVFGLFVMVAVAGIVGLVRLLHRQKEKAADDLEEEQGLPSKAKVEENYGGKQLLAAGARLRPGFTPEGRRPRPTDFGFYDGTCRGVKVYTSFETPTLLLSPSRVGKTQNYIAPRVVAAPGAVLSTTTKTEVIRMTWEHRAKLGGPMMICDPEGVGAEAGLPGTVSWCLWAGCEDVSEALARARVLAAGGAGGVDKADFWEQTTKRVLTPLLHAAAIGDGVRAVDFQRWCFDPKNAMEALDILRDDEDAADLAAMLSSVVEMDDMETRSNMWAPASNIGTALVDRRVRATFGPSGEGELDVADFLRRSGTIYLIGQEDGNASQLVLCLVDAVWRAAVRMANAAGRIEPPLHFSLDEIGNIGTLPVLPRMLSEGGGLGIQTTAAYQSLAQAEVRHGAAKAKAMWEGVTQQAGLGGIADAQVLSAFSRASGQRKVVRESMSSGRFGEGPGRSYSDEKEQVLDDFQIERMRRGLGVVREAAKPLIVVRYEPFYKRYAASKADEEQAAADVAREEAEEEAQLAAAGGDA